MTALQAAGTVVFLFMIATACASSSSAPTTSGVTGTKTVVSLADAEKRALCDWTALQYGGYGHETSCDSGTSGRGYADQSTCMNGVARIPASCSWTVSQSEACTRALSKDPCTVVTPPECKGPVECNLAGGLG